MRLPPPTRSHGRLGDKTLTTVIPALAQMILHVVHGVRPAVVIEFFGDKEHAYRHEGTPREIGALVGAAVTQFLTEQANDDAMPTAQGA